MRSKVTWWSLVILFAVLYGFVGLTATFAQAFETLFAYQDRSSLMHFSSGWILCAALSLLALTFAVGIVLSAFSNGRAGEVCVDLMRLHAGAVWGALLPFACGSAHPWIYAPLAVGGAALGLVVDRKGPGDVRPWQTWALVTLAMLVAAPVLFISRL